MNRLCLCTLLMVLSAGCSKSAEPMAAMAPEVARLKAPASYLAYEHSLEIETEAEKVGELVKLAQSACLRAAEQACAVLESTISTARSTTAHLKFRAKAEGIRSLQSLLAKQGTVSAQSTRAEDLAGPIEDGARKLAMLQSYRAKLEGLLGRANLDVEALIKLTRELAEVQGQIESLAGTQAHLVQRVETEILRVDISSERHEGVWRPVSNALSRFGGNLAEGVGSTITGMAYLIPWALVLGLIVYVFRRVRRARRGKAGG